MARRQPTSRGTGAGSGPARSRRSARAARGALPAELTDAGRPGAERLQRVLADRGVASRRACEELIESGVVEVNGVVVDALPAWVTPGDRITVEGRVVQAAAEAGEKKARGGAERLIYVMLNKPRDTVTTASDPAGRRTVLDIVQHPSGVRLFPVGRLDYDTMGLLIMTNDGELANRLTHPRYAVRKTYRALVKGSPTDESLATLERGVHLAVRKQGQTVGGERAAPVRITVVERGKERSILEITLEEGRNRQVRRMLASIGCPVKKLVRVAHGPITLRGVALGAWRELTRQEIRALRDAASGKGPRAAEREGIDHAPVRSPATLNVKPKKREAPKAVKGKDAKKAPGGPGGPGGPGARAAQRADARKGKGPGSRAIKGGARRDRPS